MPRARGDFSASPDMPVIEIDGLPYIAAEWLERRIYRDDVRAKRWRQEAGRMAKRTDADGVATHTAYLWHSLQATYRAVRWRSNLALTLAAIENRQRDTRVDFGSLIRDRRIAAGMTLRDLACLAGVDHKTILNIETASFPPSPRTLERVVAVRELGLSWDDVSPVLLEANPADGRKHRKAKKKQKKRRCSFMHHAASSTRQASGASCPG